MELPQHLPFPRDAGAGLQLAELHPDLDLDLGVVGGGAHALSLPPLSPSLSPSPPPPPFWAQGVTDLRSVLRTCNFLSIPLQL